MDDSKTDDLPRSYPIDTWDTDSKLLRFSYYGFAILFYGEVVVTGLSLIRRLGDITYSFLRAPLGIKAVTPLSSFGGAFWFLLGFTAASGLIYIVLKALKGGWGKPAVWSAPSSSRTSTLFLL